MNENRIDLAKWIQILIYIAIAGLINVLIGIPAFVPAVVTTCVSRILLVAMVFAMFQLAPANERYKKAAIQRAIVLVLSVVTDILHSGAVLTLIAGTLSIVADYQEYHGHSELIEEKDHQLSGKWKSLFMWSIIVGLILGFTSTAAGILVVMADMDTTKATILIAAILAIPQYIIEILYILYLKKMVAIFSEGYDGMEVR